MRRLVVVALVALVTVIGQPVRPAAAASMSSAKVVVVVGPVASYDAHYIADADAIAAEARRYTSNVVELKTPNATWTRVRAAAQGASVFVYLGHGNGWPSPYPPFQPNSQDGLGLDPTTGADGSAHVYYGENYIRANIRFAPNAVVLLYHLCYASGNSEPGLATGTLTTSKLRVDDYGAGFIGAGARAVFAEGHPAHPAVNYIRQLFTTNRTMDQVFRAAPTYHGHVLGAYASQRTPGLAYEMDPDTASSGFYRSLVGDLSLTAGKVTGPLPAATGLTPPDFVVPGAAEVTGTAGTGLFADAAKAAGPTGSPVSTLATGTRLRITADATPTPAPDGTRILAVSVLGGTATGFVRTTDIAPRDSAPTLAWTLDQSAAMLSPNADGTSDGLVVAVRVSEVAATSLTVRNAAGTSVWSQGITGDIVRFAWDLHASTGALVPDGTYTWSFRARDSWGNTGVSRTGTFIVDATPPVSTASAASTAGRNGWIVSPVTVTLTARDATSGVGSLWWRVDGGTATRYATAARFTGDGTRVFEYRAIDRAGIRETWHALTFKIDATPPTIALALSGTAGLAAGTWRGPVTVTPKIADATSGVGAKSVSVDGATAVALGTATVVVGGDGPHTVRVAATDLAGNTTSSTSSFTIDTVAPSIDLPPAPPTIPLVTPNGDGVSETVSIHYAVSEAGGVTAVVAGAGGTPVRTLAATVAAGAQVLAWDGRTAAGAPVHDGRYTITLTPRDAAGNVGAPVTAEVAVYSALAAVTRSPTLFFPQDGDALAPRSTVSFRLLAPAKVTIVVLDASGAVVRTGMTARSLPAGGATWTWNGKTTAGTYAPSGRYRIVVTATNGTQVAAQVATVDAMAFRLTSSTATATRGRSLVLTAVTAEPLATTPVVTVRQPGLTAWTVTMTRVSATHWTARITPKAGGTAGTMSLTVRATDTGGGRNTSVLRIALR